MIMSNKHGGCGLQESPASLFHTNTTVTTKRVQAIFAADPAILLPTERRIRLCEVLEEILFLIS